MKDFIKRTISVIMIILVILTSAPLQGFVGMDCINLNAAAEGILDYVTEFNGHYYMVCDEGLTWENAKIACEEKGGHLAVITTADENNFIIDLLKIGNKNNYWLGGYRNSNNNTWEWVTGEKFEFSNWAINQPDRYYEECLMIYRYNNPNSFSDTTNKWNDLINDGTFGAESWFGLTNFGYVCEWEGNIETGECGKNGDNVYWTLDFDIGKLTVYGSGEIKDYESWGGYRDKIKSVEIKDGVTSIGKYAFNDCDYLEKIEMSNSIVKIDDYAFYKAINLNEIVLEDNIEQIGKYAFYGCDSFKKVIIPKGTKKIGEHAFRNCEKLEYVIINSVELETGISIFADCETLKKVTIGYGLQEISDHMFSRCINLNAIIIPNSIDFVGHYAFHRCENLQNVYYRGTNVEWKEISISEANDCLDKSTIVFLGDEVNDSLSLYKTGYLDNARIKYKYIYSDDYFADSAYNYNHDLAITSMCLAVSAMPGEEEDKLKAAKEFLKTLGVESGNYTSYGYNKQPEADSIACVIGHKNITINGEESTLLIIGIRGAGYEAEWAGNFYISDSDISETHKGFDIAKQKVLGYLKNYISNKGLEGSVKFWVTGFSRAAATANLVGAALNDMACSEPTAKSKYCGLKYYKEDVYAYTFETPQNTTNEYCKEESYNNIFNIINREDAVPKVAPSVWGYRRYGVDRYIVSPETTNKSYITLKSAMVKTLSSISNLKLGDIVYTSLEWFILGGVGVYLKGQINLSAFLDRFITGFSNDIIGDVEAYVNEYQSIIRAAIIKENDDISSGDESTVEKTDDLKSEMIEALKTHLKNTFEVSLFPTAIREALSIYLRHICKEADLSYSDIDTLLEKILNKAVAVGINHRNDILTLLINIKDILNNHDPALCLAWLASSESGNIFDDDTSYSVVKFNCPIQVSLFDDEGVLKAKVTENDVQFFNDCYFTIYIDSDNQMCFCLPNDAEYKFEITGIGKGEMTCSVAEYNFETSKNESGINYYRVPIDIDTSLNMTLSEKNDDNICDDVTLVDVETNETITQSEIFDDEDIVSYTVEATTMSNTGYVIGGGKYYKGEFCKVEAFDSEYDEFVGWYIDDELISEENEFKFMPTSDCKVEAKFNHIRHKLCEWNVITPASCEIIGKQQRNCSACNYSETEEIPSTDHIWNNATCTTAKTCSTCSTTEGTALSHKDANGDYKCDYNCGYEYEKPVETTTQVPVTEAPSNEPTTKAPDETTTKPVESTTNKAEIPTTQPSTEPTTKVPVESTTVPFTEPTTKPSETTKPAETTKPSVEEPSTQHIHTEVVIPAVEATYTEGGLTEGKKCSSCGQILVAQKETERKKLKKVTNVKTKAVTLKKGSKSTLTLSWKKVTGAEKYVIQQYVNKKWKTIKTTKKTSYKVTKLKANKTYKFRVRAVAGTNKGSYSKTYKAKTIPLKPTVTLKAGKKQLTASWKQVANITGYEIQYSTSKKFTKKTTKKVTIKKAKTKKTTLKKLKKGKKYYVKVRAYKTVN